MESKFSLVDIGELFMCRTLTAPRQPQHQRDRRVFPVVTWLRAGAAAAAMGFALATAPTAVADDSAPAAPRSNDSAASADSHSAPTASRSPRSAANRKAAAASRSPRSADSREAAAVAADRGSSSSTGLAAATTARRGAGVPSPAAALRQSGVARRAAVTAARAASSPTVATALVPASATPTFDVGALLAPTASVTASSTTPVLTGITNAVNGILDGMANLLSSFPAGPVNDLLSGALLLTRRALSLIEPIPSSTAPVATSVWLPNVGTYGTNAPMTFVVNFDQPVVVTNANVALPIEINYVLANAEYVSGSGTGSLLFSLSVPAEELDPSGIDLGVVSNQTGIRVFDFGNRIVARNNPALAASNTIPTVNTSRIAVDSMGPQITGRSDLQVDGSNVTLTVTFDRPVIVTGTPTVPVVVNGVNTELSYARGSRTDTLTFRLSNPSGATISTAAFRSFVGDVIYLSSTAGIRDRTESQIYTLEGDINTPLIENGNHVVVIGQHFEKLQTLSTGDLNAVLNGVGWPPLSGEEGFWLSSTFGPPYWNGSATAPYYSEQLTYVQVGDQVIPLNWPFNNSYQYQAPVAAAYAVDVYRVAFRSSIPEEQGRYTTAYGIAAIPGNIDAVTGKFTTITGPVPVVEWQQPTVFDVTNSAPSQAFSCGSVPTCATQAENAPPRFNIAQFGGQGYAVFLPDPFGLGNSVERYAYQLVGSAAQWSTDMLEAGQALLAALDLEQSELFLGGWSAGGNEASAFLQSLQSQGQTVSGTMIASSPMALNATLSNAIFNPRFYTPQETGNAVWLNVAIGFSSLSQGGFSGQPTAALDLMGQYYDAARRLYTMQYDKVEFGSDFPGDPASQGVKVYYTDVDGSEQVEFLPYTLTDLIVPKYSVSEAAFQTSAYAGLMTANQTGNVLWTSPVRLNYGSQDEVMPVSFGRLVYDEQLALGNQDIEFTVIDSANHRGTYLSALSNALAWFNSIKAQN